MRLYKIEITRRPLVSLFERKWPDGTYAGYTRLRDDALHAKWVEVFGEEESFYNPSETKLYRSRSSAQEKVNIVERWGGSARILEAQVSEFVPVAEANRRRQEERDRVRAQKLRKKAAEIMAKHEVPF